MTVASLFPTTERPKVGRAGIAGFAFLFSHKVRTTMTSVADTLEQINLTLRAATDGPYSKYRCNTVSWDDVHRGTVSGGLSFWGANITDTRLYAKDGRQLFTVRGNNWNERLGKVTSDDIALVVNDDGGGGTKLQPFTLRSVLSDPSRFGGYAGIAVESLADDILDREVSVRFQTTFLPIDASDKEVLEFAPQAYNYNTRDDEDPRNLILLCTTQGTAFQQDGSGAKNLYHHAKVGEKVMRYWLEAESSDHKVGGAQVESKEEKEDAVRRGKATSSVIGVRSMGTRFNVLMTIQVPLMKQKQWQALSIPSSHSGDSVLLDDMPDWGCGEAACPNCGSCAMMESHEASGASVCTACGHIVVEEMDVISSVEFLEGPGGSSTLGFFDSKEVDNGSELDEAAPKETPAFNPHWTCESLCSSESDDFASIPDEEAMTHDLMKLLVSLGKSSASRVSKGGYVDSWDGLTVENPKRHPNEHVTVTIVMYYTCSGGVPTASDVRAAIDDLEELYLSVESGHLADEKFDFMKSELTVKDSLDIATKIDTQPPPPKPEAPRLSDTFPTSIR